MFLSRNIGITILDERPTKSILNLCSQRLAYLCGNNIALQNWFEENNDVQFQDLVDDNSLIYNKQHHQKIGHLSLKNVRCLFSSIDGCWMAVVTLSNNLVSSFAVHIICATTMLVVTSLYSEDSWVPIAEDIRHGQLPSVAICSLSNQTNDSNKSVIFCVSSISSPLHDKVYSEDFVDKSIELNISLYSISPQYDDLNTSEKILIASTTLGGHDEDVKSILKESSTGEPLELLETIIYQNNEQREKNMENASLRISVLTNCALYVCRLDAQQESPNIICQSMLSIDSTFTHHCWANLDNNSLYLISINKIGRLEIFRDDLHSNQLVFESRHWLEPGCAKRLTLSEFDDHVLSVHVINSILFITTEITVYPFALDIKLPDTFGSTLDFVPQKPVNFKQTNNNMELLIKAILPGQVPNQQSNNSLLLLNSKNELLKFQYQRENFDENQQHRSTNIEFTKILNFLKGDITCLHVPDFKSTIFISTINGKLQSYTGKNEFEFLFTLTQTKKTKVIKYISTDMMGTTILLLYDNGRSIALYELRSNSLGELLYTSELPEQSLKAKLSPVAKRIAVVLAKQGVRSFDPLRNTNERFRECIFSEYDCSDLDWFPDGCHIALSSKIGACTIWNSVNGQIVFKHIDHGTVYVSLKIDYSSDLRVYICAESRSVIQISRVPERKDNKEGSSNDNKALQAIKLLNLHCIVKCLYAENQILALGFTDGSVHLYDLPFDEIYGGIAKDQPISRFDAFLTSVCHITIHMNEIFISDGKNCVLGICRSRNHKENSKYQSQWENIILIDPTTIENNLEAIQSGNKILEITSQKIDSAVSISKEEAMQTGRKRCEIILNRLSESSKQANQTITNSRLVAKHNEHSVAFLTDLYKEIINFYRQAIVERIATYREGMSNIPSTPKVQYFEQCTGECMSTISGSSIKVETPKTLYKVGERRRHEMIIEREMRRLANALSADNETFDQALNFVREFTEDRIFKCNQFVQSQISDKLRKIKSMESDLSDRTQAMHDAREELSSRREKCMKLAVRFGKEMQKIAGQQAVGANRRRVLKMCQESRLHSRLEHYELRNSVQHAEQYLPYLAHCRTSIYEAHANMYNKFLSSDAINTRRKNLISDAVLFNEENKSDIVSDELMIRVVTQELNEVYRKRRLCLIDIKEIIDDINTILDIGSGRKYGGEKSPQYSIMISKMQAKYCEDIEEKTKIDEEFSRQIDYYQTKQISNVSKDIQNVMLQLAHESNSAESQRLIPLYIIAAEADQKIKELNNEITMLVEQCTELISKDQIHLLLKEVQAICKLSELSGHTSDVFELEMFICLLRDVRKRVQRTLIKYINIRKRAKKNAEN